MNIAIMNLKIIISICLWPMRYEFDHQVFGLCPTQLPLSNHIFSGARAYTQTSFTFLNWYLIYNSLIIFKMIQIIWFLNIAKMNFDGIFWTDASFIIDNLINFRKIQEIRNKKSYKIELITKKWSLRANLTEFYHCKKNIFSTTHP